MLRNRVIFDVIVPAILMCWAALLIYTAVASDSGYRALAKLEIDVEAKASEVDALRQRRAALEKRADQLNSKTLDPDLVDERIRSILGYSRDGDVVIPRHELDKVLRQRPTSGR